MKFTPTLPAFLFIAFLFSSCKPMPNGGIPFYMKMDSVVVNSDYPDEGANTENVSDVWVEVGADNLGAYEMPCNFPVLQENNVRFVVSAGVLESAQSGLRVIYPFYTPDTFSFAAARGEQYNHTPTFAYKDATTFSFIDDFDSGNKFTGMTPIELPDSNVKYGTRCGMLTVTTDSAKEAKLIDEYDLPEGQQIWLEVDYKCDVPFYIGYYANYGSGSDDRYPILFVNPKSTWNKVYVNLTNYIVQTQATTYQIYFEALRPYNTAGGNVYIDNVKLLHF
jgi:hypothetical protein